MTPVTRPVRRGVLTNRRQDHRLHRDGFVVVDLIDPHVASELASSYLARRVEGGHGFEADLNNPDTAYRRTVSGELSAALDDRVTDLFVAHQPFLRVYLCKWPGPDSDLYLHRDWMYVDERAGHRSYVVWIALSDVSGHQGQLQVLRGSHRLDPSLRGSNLNAAWIQHDDLIRPRLEAVPTTPGQAVIFDNALVHCSHPNNTDAPRVAAAIGLRPRAANLVHFHGAEREALGYDVDDRFFLTHTPSELEAAPPAGLVATERIVAPAAELSRDELADQVDRGRPGFSWSRRRRRSAASA